MVGAVAHHASGAMKLHHDMADTHMQLMKMLLEQMMQQDEMMMESLPAR